MVKDAVNPKIYIGLTTKRIATNTPDIFRQKDSGLLCLNLNSGDKFFQGRWREYWDLGDNDDRGHSTSYWRDEPIDQSELRNRKNKNDSINSLIKMQNGINLSSVLHSSRLNQEMSALADTLADDNFRDGTVIGIAIDTSSIQQGLQIRYFKDGVDMGVAFGFGSYPSGSSKGRARTPVPQGNSTQIQKRDKFYPIVQISQEGWSVQVFEPKIWPMIPEIEDNMHNFCGQISEQDEEDSRLETQQKEEDQEKDEKEDQDKAAASESSYSYYSETHESRSVSKVSQVKSPLKIQKN